MFLTEFVANLKSDSVQSQPDKVFVASSAVGNWKTLQHFVYNKQREAPWSTSDWKRDQVSQAMFTKLKRSRNLVNYGGNPIMLKMGVGDLTFFWQGLAVNPRLSSSSLCSPGLHQTCLSPLSAGITGVHHQAWLNFYFCGTGMWTSYLQSRCSMLDLQSLFAWLFWRWGLLNCLPGLASNCDPPDFSLPSSYDYFRGESLAPSWKYNFYFERGLLYRPGWLWTPKLKILLPQPSE
jgi:hypothetical protein